MRLTADGDLAVIHDDTVDRTTDGRGRVRDLAMHDLRRLDAGAWFGPAFAGERVPSLAETIALLAELGLGANLEIKAEAAEAGPTAGALGRILDRCWPATLPLPLLSSFEMTVLEAMRDAAPQWPRGLLLKKLAGDWHSALARLGAATLNLDHRPLDEAAVTAARCSGLPVLVYTVNDPARARQLLRWGATAIFTDRPEIAASLDRP